jgi:hypothetical protein
MGLITRRPQFIVDLHAAWAFIASDISNGCKRMHSSESIRGVVVCREKHHAMRYDFEIACGFFTN